MLQTTHEIWEQGRIDGRKNFPAPPVAGVVGPGRFATGVVEPGHTTPEKQAVDLTLRPLPAFPEISHRDLPHLEAAISTVVGVADPGRALSKSDSDERVKSGTAQQFQIIALLSKLYVLMANAAGPVLVDLRAAHQR